MLSALGEPASSAVLAGLTTLHLTIMLLRKHHNPPAQHHDVLLLPSLALSGAPWLCPSAVGLAAGAAAHLAWFYACEHYVRRLVANGGRTTTPAVAQRQPSARAATTPASGGRAQPPKGFVSVPVFSVFEETPNIKTFRMARPEGFEFEAGQFITVRVNVDGRKLVRCYSISSSPLARGYLEISVKRQGVVSGTLHATVRPGAMLAVGSPSGAFAYPAGDDRPVTLIAGGVGITPLMSMLRHAVHAEPNRPVTMLYSVHSQRDVAYSEELRWMARRNPQVRIMVTTTRGPRSTEYLSGRIDRKMLQDSVADLANNVFMICGPGPLIDGMKTLLNELGVPEAQVRAEAFESAIASTADQAPAPVEPAGVAGAGGTVVELRLLASGRTVQVDAGCTLLEGAEAVGVELPSACRAGVCGTCRCRLVEGEVDCSSDLLDETDRAEGYILPCIARPVGDLALEA